MLELTGRTDLQPSIGGTGLLELTGCTISGFTGYNIVQTLTGHTGLLKFRYTDHKGRNWSSTIENDTNSAYFLGAFKFWRSSVIRRDSILQITLTAFPNLLYLNKDHHYGKVRI